MEYINNSSVFAISMCLIYSIVLLLIGYILGYMTGRKHKEILTIEKRLAILFFFIWIGFHIIAFINGNGVEFYFNLVGTFSAGTLLGIRASEKTIDLVVNKIKGQGK